MWRLLARPLLLLAALILIFAVVYSVLEGWSVTDCLFHSTMISCLVGLTRVPKYYLSKYAMATQALLSVVLLSNFLIVGKTK